MVDLVQDFSKLGYYMAFFAGATFISFLGRAYPNIATGVFWLLLVIQALAFLFGLLVFGSAMGAPKAEGEETNIVKAAIAGGVPTGIALLTIWLGCVLGFHVGS